MDPVVKRMRDSLRISRDLIEILREIQQGTTCEWTRNKVKLEIEIKNKEMLTSLSGAL